MTDASQIAKTLTEAQRGAMLRNDGSRCSSYALRASLSTMEALSKRGLCRRVGGVGSSWSPQTAITWPLTKLGLQVKAILETT